MLVFYQKIIFQVSLEWLGFFRLSSVSFGSGLYTKTRNTDVHGCTDNKCEKYFPVIFLAILFKPLKFFHFYLVIGLWLLCLSAFPWFSRALSPIFWGFSDVKHLHHGSWNSALCMFSDMKLFSQHVCTCLHNDLIFLVVFYCLVDGLLSFIGKEINSHMCDSHLNMHQLKSNFLPSSRKESTFHRVNVS